MLFDVTMLPVPVYEALCLRGQWRLLQYSFLYVITNIHTPGFSFEDRVRIGHVLEAHIEHGRKVLKPY